MSTFPEDIFTEPNVNPDTLSNLGPLRRLAGVWQGRKGGDVNPKALGPERRSYLEHPQTPQSSAVRWRRDSRPFCARHRTM